MSSKPVKLSPSWMPHLEPALASEKMQELRRFLVEQNAKGRVIFPKPSEYFFALDKTPLDKVRVVILGQDPYHGDGQAHGLCFSVQKGVRVPPSLVNIYKEINDDLGLDIPPHGNLTHWAEQGVLLLNSVLTVERGEAASHRGHGWEEFTDQIIRAVNEQCENVVFMLWGSYAQKKAAFVDQAKHCVLKAPHPSPLSAHRGFMGCGHFSKANTYLESQGFAPIDWNIPG